MQDRVSLDVDLAFVVNGKPVTVRGAPTASLAVTLRHQLGLTGTKIGCDAGDCGACTVIIDGHQACACLIATAQASGAEIRTVEHDDPILNRLRDAFLRRGAAQCGICTPGMLIAAFDLLAHNRLPSRENVGDAIGGVLCRCTGYIKIVDAILDAAEGTAAAFTETDVGGVVGKRLQRVDGAPKVAGTDRFGADHAPEDALWMRVVRSPHARARFTLGDLDAIKARVDGLVAVLTARDIPGANSFGVFPDTKDQPVLADGAVRFRGEAVLALVGTRTALENISDADLPIQWHQEQPLIGIDAALAAGAPAIHSGIRDNVLTRGNLECGNTPAR